ncbi:pig-Q [Schizosaccharomyces cryophilus OY26]|uniref:Pig-Q n=1 Tax=Schizosaccharomyces cryophilus (strain OY26 / ATCC MYA-4695 / CBS 11777 / NBRC 106824 / NRRL Y48691) TaxID=653667 RepID=S9W889_SCHCR|nr:pig-Q [Schizosaccharomyces cryophilus OY26]EPY53980.1 pig-Q [Schizosaccharomyces cryophilus OY26]
MSRVNTPLSFPSSRFNPVLRVYWPKNQIQHTDSGYLVGWIYSPFDLVIVTVIKDTSRLDEFLKNNQSSFYEVQSLGILGTLNLPSSSYVPKPEDSWLIIRLRTQFSHPQIYRVSDSDLFLNLHVIYYVPPQPKRLQFLSLEPLSLLLLKDSVFDDSSPEFKKNQHLQTLLHKLDLHFPRRPENTWYRSLRNNLVELLNQSFEVHVLMQECPNRSKNLLIESSKRSFLFIFNLFHPIVLFFLIFLRVLNEFILQVINYRLHPVFPNMRDVFVSARQVDLRLQQACFWPVQYMKLWMLRKSKHVVMKDYKEYIRLYNNLWLVANDIIFGITMCSFILDNLPLVVNLLDKVVFKFAIKDVRVMVTWLIDTPAGLKLNNDICKFIVKLSIWIIDVWYTVLLSWRQYIPSFVRIIAFSGFGGASLMIALMSDFLSIMTLHLYILYLAAARLYNWQLRIIYSLLQLFRGKKRNVLRNRIDSYEYDLDQLLLGTILFTVLIFFLPTIYVFYIAFAVTRITVMTCLALYETILAFLNHFPLFVTMLRIKDPYRIPSGLSLEIVNSECSKENTMATLYLFCKSKPMSFGSMFDHYRKLARRLISHYLSKTTLISLLVGCPIPPIPAEQLYNIQYAMLPHSRISAKNLWKLFFESN